MALRSRHYQGTIPVGPTQLGFSYMLSRHNIAQSTNFVLMNYTLDTMAPWLSAACRVLVDWWDGDAVHKRSNMGGRSVHVTCINVETFAFISSSAAGRPYVVRSTESIRRIRKDATGGPAGGAARSTTVCCTCCTVVRPNTDWKRPFATVQGERCSCAHIAVRLGLSVCRSILRFTCPRSLRGRCRRRCCTPVQHRVHTHMFSATDNLHQGMHATQPAPRQA
jgi:hypothetical protein